MPMLSTGTRPARRRDDLVQDDVRVERGEDRLGHAQQLALAAELALERRRLLSELLGGVGVGHRLGGQRGVDLEQSQVVARELVEPELGEDDDAHDALLEDHRRDEHRLVDGVGARDGLGAVVGVGVGQVLRDAVRGHPAGDALADLEAELVLDLVGVLADVAAPGDRQAVVADDAIDAHVVVVDELLELDRDGHADLAHAAHPVEPRAELLDRLELRRPARHLGVGAGILDGDAGLRGEGLERLQLRARPRPMSVVVEDEHAERSAFGDERRHGDRVEALLDDRLAQRLAHVDRRRSRWRRAPRRSPSPAWAATVTGMATARWR